MSQTSGPGSSSSWKKRLTPKQLEKKRQSDRLSQRRTRGQARRTMAELEERLRLLASGEHETLINRLLAENEMLRSKLNHYQSKMEAMYLCSKECLDESDNEESSAMGSGSWNVSSTQRLQDLPGGRAEVPGTSGPDAAADNEGQRNPMIAPTVTIGRPSMISEAAALARRSQSADKAANLEVNELLQSMIAWKMTHSSRTSFAFLIEQFELEKPPISLTVEVAEMIEQLIIMPDFYEKVILSISLGTKLPEASPTAHTQHRVEDPTVVEYERRAVLVCACARLWYWKSYFRSAVEFTAMFWAQYRYLIFLTFPTEENLNKLPTWLKPTQSQMAHEHPGFVDFLVWPHLREYLVATWHQYDPEKLIVQLVKNFEEEILSDLINTPLLQVIRLIK
ncbi:hypothetical protein NKR23_g5885 [Pleurostoma richardsiae]|uniref:BZIP transcription factor n=1 Tax=Pleurostoma richardsiae TaxID=41990 RepID=A0AA38RF16_9PEZI|nr:hypothetical protein NKR23_g5885 [Pleurostoma richardsiae]